MSQPAMLVTCRKMLAVAVKEMRLAVEASDGSRPAEWDGRAVVSGVGVEEPRWLIEGFFKKNRKIKEGVARVAATHVGMGLR